MAIRISEGYLEYSQSQAGYLNAAKNIPKGGQLS